MNEGKDGLKECLRSGFSLVCPWLCWNSKAQSPLRHSRSTRHVETEYSTQNHLLLSYQSWNSSQSATEKPYGDFSEIHNAQTDTNNFNTVISCFISMSLDILTWPCMFMMTTVLDRLHTTKCSGFLGSWITLLTVMSVPAEVPRDLNVLVHSVVFTFQIWEKENAKSEVGYSALHFMSSLLKRFENRFN